MFFHNQHFYEQRQAEIGKKTKQKLIKPWGRTFAIWKLLGFFIHVIILK